ncbi:hypothetical protein K1T71_011053 [Dendrolimus kikuchii]|uniref:Uncharacterized protein n=1 Tax=Dendrolimus kikuchii TaxID=765133 RepID=A0ACC1CMR3_9NEOP|nr:hypothetical protein K1T71_011053 [Dendrolimus kikuchii]
MEKLLQKQVETLEAIKQIERNFGKDSSSRKTRQYLDERIDRLDRLWAEFSSGNDKLSPYVNSDVQYFAENQYEKTHKYFLSVRQKLTSLRLTTPGDIDEGFALPGPSFKTPTRPLTPAPEPPTATPRQAVELLNLQRTNFRAFRRLTRSIEVENINTKWELEDELRSLQYRWNDIDSLHLKIDNILQGSDSEYEEEFTYYECSYKALKRSLNNKLASTAHIQHSTPQLDVPTFTGRYTQWPTFCDLYSQSIHNNNLLTKCQKMQHLKGKLKGEAERLIQHLYISNENYDTAWELLTHRYNNPILLFTNHIENFLNQPNIQKQTANEIKRLYDITGESIHGIQNLGIDTSTWDTILVHLICKKLDQATYDDYKVARKSPRELPTLAELMDFLESKFIALEPLRQRERSYSSPPNKHSNIYQQPKGSYKPTYQKYQPKENHQRREFQSSATGYVCNCPYCNNKHVLYKCGKFLKLTPDAKLRSISQLQVCRNCLYKHIDNKCNSTKTCKICHCKHSTILHDAFSMSGELPTTPASPTPRVPGPSRGATLTAREHNANHVASEEEEILLTTLLVRAKAADGTYITLRALLDQGSQISLISENAVQQLGLPRQHYHASVFGVGHGSKPSRGIVTLELQSIYDDYKLNTQALVLPRVINNLPNISFKKQPWEHIQHLQLADPEYNISRTIDLLLDASVYSDILMSGLIKGPTMAPIAQQTRLGWIISGNVRTFNCHVVLNNIKDLSQYWEMEEISDTTSALTPEEQYCEDLYQSSTRRLEDGRYEVALPMKLQFKQNLGLSKPKAIAQFHSIENKFKQNKNFADSYKQFMLDYEILGNMKRVENNNNVSCYLPHHGVLKPDSSTTQLRTVFNASSKTSSGYSLNDLMERGPNLQRDLQSLLLTWRQHKYVISADIEKMFRQILIRERDQDLQRIIWRTSAHEPLSEYKLTTITYGTKAAPYLAMRTLKQLALDNEEAQRYPMATKALKNSFYMDDLLEGGDSLEQTRTLQYELIQILKEAGMNIRKWSSNSLDLVKDLPTNSLAVPLHFKNIESRKTLGLSWKPDSDTFTFQNRFEQLQENTQLTKRQLLSYISKIYDPLGWLSPLTIRAKLLFQNTWLNNSTTWDGQLPDEIKEAWNQLNHDFQHLNTFEIPRYLGQKQTYTLHAFCDASEKVYACAIYVVTNNNKGECTSRLVTAKTKLAPVKTKLTLPRLELCGAVLLTRLLKKVMETLTCDKIETFAWTDSMIVLGWIHGGANRWKQFVSNRVQTIITVVPPSHWHHVSSAENAADCATRGLSANQLQGHSLWWEGPRWLKNFHEDQIGKITYPYPQIETKKLSVHAALCENKNFIIKLLNDMQSIRRVATTIGWLSRYIEWLRNKQNIPIQGYLTNMEINHSYNLIIKTVQFMEFQEDFTRLKGKQCVKRNSKLICLNPYLDEKDGLLKVGGRLSNSHLSQSAKHPIILPSHSRLTDLIIRQAHLTTLHGGPSLTLTHIREKYWILSGLRTVKRELNKCVTCRKHSDQSRPPIMADLPAPRVTPSRPFTHAGVDFTGHFDIKANKGRGVRTHKGYVAVFVCLSTKAVHLELVSDLSTPGFLAAFRRFCARRGTPSHVYSDNGTNFVGANRLLKKEYQEIAQSINRDFFNNIKEYNIQWTFNAPAYPSAGGLWEAAVKSFKYHLRRVIGEQKLTYEEFITLLHQIEACLNSRPLITVNENSSDICLTPGHFLIGDTLLSRPQTDSGNINLTTRWRMIQAMNKDIWKAWSSDYLKQLQARTKWRTPTKNIEVEDIVLVKEENLPPGKWALGRVVDVHPGKDGHVRVVSLKTKHGVIKRPALKLSVLPVKKDEDETSLEQGDETSRPRRSTRKGAFHYMTMALLLLMAVIMPVECTYSISPFDKNQSIYFDKMYDMNIIRDEWKLIIYYNMSSYWSGLHNIENYVTHLDNYLRKNGLASQYKSIVYQLKHEISEIEHYNSILQNQISKRQKRGLINGVGYLANSLFGVLDDSFAQKYEKDIQQITQNENHLQQLFKNQTSVLEAQYNIMRRNEDIMNRQFKIVENHLRNISQILNQVESQQRIELYFISSSLAANIIISSLRRIQTTLINIITDITHGHNIDIHLLPPEQLIEQVNVIRSHLQNDLTLPAENENVQELYKLLKLNVKINNNFLIIEVKFPLQNKDTLELDSVISIPYPNHIVRFITPYIAFNLRKNLLLFLTETDIRTCIHLPRNRILSIIPETSILNHITNTTFSNFTMENHDREWNNIKTQIDVLKQQSNISFISTHDIHLYAVSYTVLAVVILGGMTYWAKRCWKNRRRAVAPEPFSVVFQAAQKCLTHIHKLLFTNLDKDL